MQRMLRWKRDSGAIETNPGDTREQAAQALDRLIASVEAGQSDQMKAYLATLARFHRYSVSNSLLIMAQFPLQAKCPAKMAASARYRRQSSREALT